VRTGVNLEIKIIDNSSLTAILEQIISRSNIINNPKIYPYLLLIF
jgi:hypothetical protein